MLPSNLVISSYFPNAENKSRYIWYNIALVKIEETRYNLNVTFFSKFVNMQWYTTGTIKTRTCFGRKLTLAGLAPDVANPNIESSVVWTKQETLRIRLPKKVHTHIQILNSSNTTNVCCFAVKFKFWSCNLPTVGCGRPWIWEQRKSLRKIGDNAGLIMQRLLFVVYVSTFIIFLIFRWRGHTQKLIET